MKKSYILILILQFFVEYAPCKEILLESKSSIKQDIVFQRFASESGLPDNRIRSVYQDSLGFLWIGTMNGLCKYDGYTFRNYYKGSTNNSIAGNWIYSICEDRQHRIWIGTTEGLSCIDPELETTIDYLHQDNDTNSLSHNKIYTLMSDDHDFLWIGTAKGLTKYNLITQEFQQFDFYPFNTSITNIIASSYDDCIWIATSNGIVRYNTERNQYHLYPIDITPTPFGERFWSLLENDRDLLIATGNCGLLKLPYNKQTNDYESFLSMKISAEGNEIYDHIQVFDICKSQDGDIWLGTDNGLGKVEDVNMTNLQLVFYKNEPINHKSISYNTVYSVYIDATGVLWCGTEIGLNKTDLHLLPFRFFTLTDQHSKEQIRTIYSKNADDIWLGMARKGFVYHNLTDKNTRWYRFSPEASIFNATRSVLYDNNKLWLGTYGGTIHIPLKVKEQYVTEIDGATYAFLKDSKENLWIGTNNGLHKISESGKRTRYRHNPIKNENGFIRTIYEDHRGRIWCGLEMDGVYLLDTLTDTFTPIFNDGQGNRVLGSIIFSVIEYPENIIWIGSESGLSKITYMDDLFTVKNYTDIDGLSDKSISGILSDNNGNLWISTIKGLTKFNIEKELFDYYLTDFNFSPSCYYKSDDGQLFFGADDGFIIFNPEHICSNTYLPKVVITDFKIFNKSVNIGDTINRDVILKKSIVHTQEITLNHNNNNFSINFVALHFSNPKKCKYAYMLKGYNEKWIQADATNLAATYTNLNAGTYIFMVKAANNSGIWNNTPVELKIIILPPPWKTWWAIAIYIIATMLIIVTIVRYYMLQIKQRQQIEIEKREKEQLVQLNQMKLRFFTDIAHEFRTPLMLITGPIEELLSSAYTQTRQKIELIYRNCAKLNYLIDELMTFRKIDQNMMSVKPVKMDIVKYMKELFNSFVLVAEQKKINMTFDSEFEEQLLWIDPKKLEKVFNNLLLNAFKFTEVNDSIAIRITESDQKDKRDYICIEVKDTGKGIASEDLDKVFERFYQVDTNSSGTGIGLSLAKNLIGLHHGAITVESELSRFTVFKVFLPVGDKHLSAEQKKSSSSSDWKQLDTGVISCLVDANYSELTPKKKSITKNEQLLIVDDNSETLYYLSTMFDNYHTATAENGAKALELLKLQDFDLVISDVMMPVMDGLELCKTLKRDISTCHIPVILLTAKSAVEHLIEGIEGGADDYLAKPFHPDVLKARVHNLIESRKQMVEKFRSNKLHELYNISPNNIDQEFIQTVVPLILENIQDPDFDVEQLCSLIGMSRSNFFRKIKAMYGQNPIEFINSIRMKRAIELLLENKMNISEIAFQLGFQNVSSFGKIFRKHYQMSPREYLKSTVEAKQNLIL